MPQNNKFDIRQSINSDTVIGFTSHKEMKTQGWLDSNKVYTYLMDGENTHRKHLGMINLFNTTHNVSVPFMRDLFKNSAVIEVAEGETLTYDLPVNRSAVRCVTAEDTSDYTDYPGIDGNVFKLVLNYEFTKGDFLTYDPIDGQQVMVSEEHEVEREADSFVHWVILQTNDKTAWFPKEKLEAGIQYMKVGHALAEFGTDYSGINLLMNPTGSITNEFILGSPRGVETFYTKKAASMKSPGLTAFADQMRTSVEEQMQYMNGGKNDMFFIAKKDKSGRGIDKNSMHIGFTMEYLSLMELAKMEAYSLLFARPATVQTSNGVKRVNEGVWHQMRRGKLITYARPGGITLNHIHEAASYIFKNSTMTPEQRVLRFKGGWYASQNVLHLFREEAIAQSLALPQNMLGTDKQISKPIFSGELNNLKMEAVAIRSVLFPGIGRVEVEHDPSLDFQPMSDRFSSGFFGEGYAWTSYSLIIWDATNPQYSNVESKITGPASVIEGGNKNANIYYVKPEGNHLTYGYELGRMADKGAFENVQSSLKVMGRSFWAHSQSAALVLDTTRFVTIELAR